MTEQQQQGTIERAEDVQLEPAESYRWRVSLDGGETWSGRLPLRSEATRSAAMKAARDQTGSFQFRRSSGIDDQVEHVGQLIRPDGKVDTEYRGRRYGMTSRRKVHGPQQGTTEVPDASAYPPRLFAVPTVERSRVWDRLDALQGELDDYVAAGETPHPDFVERVEAFREEAAETPEWIVSGPVGYQVTRVTELRIYVEREGLGIGSKLARGHGASWIHRDRFDAAGFAGGAGTRTLYADEASAWKAALDADAARVTKAERALMRARKEARLLVGAFRESRSTEGVNR